MGRRRKMKKQGTNKGWAYILLSMMLIGFALTLVGCKTIEYVPVEVVKTQTKDHLVEVHDSVYIRDSTVIHTKGDTVFKDKWKLIYKNRYVHDTTYIHRTDSIPVPCPVEKQLGKWEQFKLDYMGYISTILLAALAVLIIYTRWQRKQRNNTSHSD